LQGFLASCPEPTSPDALENVHQPSTNFEFSPQNTT
jgi:hypothetical protein